MVLIHGAPNLNFKVIFRSCTGDDEDCLYLLRVSFVQASSFRGILGV